jgi:hypothetical protein
MATRRTLKSRLPNQVKDAVGFKNELRAKIDSIPEAITV